MKLRNILISTIFLLILGLGFLNQLFHFIPDIPYKENRSKAQMPVLKQESLNDFPQAYNAYLRDHFSLRGSFLASFGWIQEKLFKKATNPDKVILGKEGWLYNVQGELDCFLGKQYYTPAQLDVFAKEFRYRKRILDSMGIKMLIVINPIKYSVYPEYLPGKINAKQTKSTGEQLVNYISSTSDIDIFYSKQILMPLKDSLKLYLKADNHWTAEAAYYVGSAIMTHINKDALPIPLSEFCPDTIYKSIGNLASMLGNAGGHSEDLVKLEKCNDDAQTYNRYTYTPPEEFIYKWKYQASFRTENPQALDALIIRDSFGDMLIPYLKNSFYHSTFIWDNWEYKFNLEIIKQEQPDVVIYSILESLLPTLYEHGLSKNWQNILGE